MKKQSLFVLSEFINFRHLSDCFYKCISGCEHNIAAGSIFQFSTVSVGYDLLIDTHSITDINFNVN